MLLTCVVMSHRNVLLLLLELLHILFSLCGYVVCEKECVLYKERHIRDKTSQSQSIQYKENNTTYLLLNPVPLFQTYQ